MDTYKEKYNEALERARNLHKDAIDMGENLRAKQCEVIFPELKESEDEKTRKIIIALVNAHGQGMYKDDMLAWLENIPYTIDHEKREGFHLGYKAGLEKQGETFTKKDVDDAYLKGISDAKNELEKQGEQKPAWSCEDTIKIHNLITMVKCGGSIKTDLRDEYEDWLKSLRPQPKQEWSEEDEMTIKILIGLVETYFCGCIDKSEKNRVLDWLKSLKQRIGG